MMNSSDHIRKGACGDCIALGENFVHSRTPGHDGDLVGAFHLKLPIGGAANGMPLKIDTASSFVVRPET